MVANSACSNPGATSVARRVIGVSVQVGQTQLTRIPSGALSRTAPLSETNHGVPLQFLRTLTGGFSDTRDSMLACGVLTGSSQSLLCWLYICTLGLSKKMETYTMLETAMNSETEDRLTIDPRVVPRVGSVALACRGS